MLEVFSLIQSHLYFTSFNQTNVDAHGTAVQVGGFQRTDRNKMAPEKGGKS